MRIAAISDIHGDLKSMRLVWRDIEARGLSEQTVLNAGDTVAYGPDTMECIEFVRSPLRQIVSVGGNYDANAAKFPKKQDNYQRKWGHSRPEKYNALKQASEDLTGDAREWLRGLPAVEKLEFAGHTVSLSHYAPTEEKEGLFAMTDQGRLCRIAKELGGEVDIVVVGHTHSPFVRRAGDVLFINPGSVGRSFGRPTYAEIEIEAGRLPTARIIACPATQP